MAIWNGAPARLGLLLEPIGRKAERRAVEKAACDRAIERVDDGRDEGLGEIERAPFRIGREGGLHLRPCRMQTLVEIGPVARVVEIEPKALKKESDRARTRVGAKIPVRPAAQSAVPVGLVVWADERRQFRLGQHPMLHLPRDGDGAVRPHEPGQRRVEIGSPIVEGLAPAAGRQPGSWASASRSRLGLRRRAMPNVSAEFARFGRRANSRSSRNSAILDPSVNSSSSRACPNALDPLGDLDPPRQPVHQLGPRDAVGAA